jgi:hypothetical protein
MTNQLDYRIPPSGLWEYTLQIFGRQIARGDEPPDTIDAMLSVKDFPSKPQYNMADDAPLVLFQCGFDNIALPVRTIKQWNNTNVTT